MNNVEHITYYTTNTVRTFCTQCTWTIATENRSLNLQAFDKHICGWNIP